MNLSAGYPQECDILIQLNVSSCCLLLSLALCHVYLWEQELRVAYFLVWHYLVLICENSEKQDPKEPRLFQVLGSLKFHARRYWIFASCRPKWSNAKVLKGMCQSLTVCGTLMDTINLLGGELSYMMQVWIFLITTLSQSSF